LGKSEDSSDKKTEERITSVPDRNNGNGSHHETLNALKGRKQQSRSSSHKYSRSHRSSRRGDSQRKRQGKSLASDRQLQRKTSSSRLFFLTMSLIDLSLLYPFNAVRNHFQRIAPRVYTEKVQPTLFLTVLQSMSVRSTDFLRKMLSFL